MKKKIITEKNLFEIFRTKKKVMNEKNRKMRMDDERFNREGWTSEMIFICYVIVRKISVLLQIKVNYKYNSVKMI